MISLPTSQLKPALAALFKVAAPKHPLPVMTCIDLVVSGNEVTLTATDLETTARLTLPLSSLALEPLSVAIPARVFAEVVALSDRDAISIVVDEQLTVTLSDGSGTAEIKGIAHDEFPPMLLPDVSLGSLPAAELKDALKRVHQITRTVDSMRYGLATVLLQKRDGETYLVTADGFRLAACRISDLNIPESAASLLIPRAAAGKLLQLLPENDQPVEVAVSKDRRNIGFKWEGAHVMAQLVDSAYPDWKAVIPATFQHEIWFESKATIEAINRANVFAREVSHVTRFVPVPGQGTLIAGASTETGKSETLLEPFLPLSLALNGVFARQGIEGVGSESVRVCVTAPNAPVVFTNGTDRFTYVLMPMHTDDDQKAAAAAAARADETEA